MLETVDKIGVIKSHDDILNYVTRLFKFNKLLEDNNTLYTTDGYTCVLSNLNNLNDNLFNFLKETVISIITKSDNINKDRIEFIDSKYVSHNTGANIHSLDIIVGNDGEYDIFIPLSKLSSGSTCFFIKPKFSSDFIMTNLEIGDFLIMKSDTPYYLGANITDKRTTYINIKIKVY